MKAISKSDLKEANPLFFSRDTMLFFGDTMSNFGLSKDVVIRTVSGDLAKVYMLYRKRPVKHGFSDPHFFGADLKKVFRNGGCYLNRWKCSDEIMSWDLSLCLESSREFFDMVKKPLIKRLSKAWKKEQTLDFERCVEHLQTRIREFLKVAPRYFSYAGQKVPVDVRRDAAAAIVDGIFSEIEVNGYDA